MLGWYLSGLLIFPAILYAMYTQYKVKSTFAKQSKVLSANGMTGAQVARGLLDVKGLGHVPVELIPGSLSDHYDPRSQVLRLSPEVYQSSSVAALGVAAHEAGHAIQHQEHYSPLSIRNSVVPVANLGSSLAIPLVFLGAFLGSENLILLGIVAFSFAVFFQIVTLPVEFDASSRAMALLERTGYLTPAEIKPARSVLNAAAMTYVAALIVSLAQLLRFVLLFLGNSRDD